MNISNISSRLLIRTVVMLQDTEVIVSSNVNMMSFLQRIIVDHMTTLATEGCQPLLCLLTKRFQRLTRGVELARVVREYHEPTRPS